MNRRGDRLHVVRDETAPVAARTGVDAVIDRLAAVELSTLMVWLGVMLAGFVRLDYILAADFPLNDGGLFYQMTRDIQMAGFRLPATTPYNFADIPFAYPPLGFYLSALIDGLTPLSLFDVFRILPLVVSCSTVAAVYLLAKDLLHSRTAIVVAVFAFALVPRSFVWLLMGGGVTRSLGLLFAVLALHRVVLMYRRGRWRDALIAAVLCALTVLSHLQTGSFLAFSSVALFLAYGRNQQGVIHSFVVAVGTIGLTAPWWVSVIAAHGFAPFIAANATGGSVFSDAASRQYIIESLLSLRMTSEPLFPLIATLALLGAIASLTSRRFFLPAWWLAIVLLDARAFPTFATLPIAMLAGVGVEEVVLPLALRPLRERWWLVDDGRAEQRFDGVLISNVLRSWAPLVLGALLWYGVNGALLRAGETPSLAALSPDERSAMAWVKQTTEPASRFLIVSAEAWPTDKTSEWFPVLADRMSVATVQGTEWVTGGAFERQTWVHDQAQGCAYVQSSCVVQWRGITGLSYDYLMIPKPADWQCCAQLLDSLHADAHFQAVYDGPGAVIYRYVG